MDLLYTIMELNQEEQTIILFFKIIDHISHVIKIEIIGYFYILFKIKIQISFGFPSILQYCFDILTPKNLPTPPFITNAILIKSPA